MKASKFIVAALIFLLLLPPPAASADGGSLATCAGSWNVKFASPGVGPTYGEPRFVAPPGSLTCLGEVDGAQALGPATFEKKGIFYGSCLSGKADGKLVVKVLTTGDVWKTVKSDFRMVTGPGLGFKFGESLFGPLTMVFHPTEGDCVLSPVGEISIIGEFSLRT